MDGLTTAQDLGLGLGQKPARGGPKGGAATGHPHTPVAASPFGAQARAAATDGPPTARPSTVGSKGMAQAKPPTDDSAAKGTPDTRPGAIRVPEAPARALGPTGKAGQHAHASAAAADMPSKSDAGVAQIRPSSQEAQTGAGQNPRAADHGTAQAASTQADQHTSQGAQALSAAHVASSLPAQDPSLTAGTGQAAKPSRTEGPDLPATEAPGANKAARYASQRPGMPATVTGGDTPDKASGGPDLAAAGTPARTASQTALTAPERKNASAAPGKARTALPDNSGTSGASGPDAPSPGASAIIETGLTKGEAALTQTKAARPKVTQTKAGETEAPETQGLDNAGPATNAPAASHNGEYAAHRETSAPFKGPDMSKGSSPAGGPVGRGEPAQGHVPSPSEPPVPAPKPRGTDLPDAAHPGQDKGSQDGAAARPPVGNTGLDAGPQPAKGRQTGPANANGSPWSTPLGAQDRPAANPGAASTASASAPHMLAAAMTSAAGAASASALSQGTGRARTGEASGPAAATGLEPRARRTDGKSGPAQKVSGTEGSSGPAASRTAAGNNASGAAGQRTEGTQMSASQPPGPAAGAGAVQPDTGPGQPAWAAADPATPPPSAPSQGAASAPFEVQGLQSRTAPTNPGGPMGDPAASQTARAEALAEDISVQMVRNARNGVNRFELRLDPPELGRIDIRMEISADGSVQANLTVDRADALDLLRADARLLDRALNEAGLKTDSGSLSFNLRQDQGAPGDQRGEGSSGSPPGGSGGEPGETDAGPGAKGTQASMSVAGEAMTEDIHGLRITVRQGVNVEI